MSYNLRNYRHRNPKMGEEKKTATPFFQNSTDPSAQTKKNAFFQAKLTIGQPGDAYEREADSVASRVVNQTDRLSPVIQQKEISGIQRLATSKEDERFSTNDSREERDKEEPLKPLQRMHNEGMEDEKKETVQKMAAPEKEMEKDESMKPGSVQMKAAQQSPASQHLSSRIENSSGKGYTLPPKSLTEMNQSFGLDFSNVRVHSDNESAGMNKELNAHAFTYGSDIYFNSGKFNPESSSGKQLLAHELTHVIQQGGSIKKKEIQRSCNDGKCDKCIGGTRDFWITIFFRRLANQKTLSILEKEINEATNVLKNCCLNLKVNYDWHFLKGGGSFEPFAKNPDGSPNMSKMSADAINLGMGNAFDKSIGLPVLVADEVLHSGGGVTITEKFDPVAYKGRTYAVLGINQPAFFQGCNALAHELWHVADNLNHNASVGSNIASCTGNTLNEKYCRDVRSIVAPTGDFESSKGKNAEG